MLTTYDSRLSTSIVVHAVKLDQFEGPLDLLLQLIEQEELDITTIALAQVCEEYLARLRALEQRPPEELADFLVIAAKLLYLKSLALVPGAPAPEDDTTGLTEQLRLYRAFATASQEIARRYEGGAILYAAERLPIALPAFSPPPRCTASALRDVFLRIVSELEPIVRIPRAVIGRVISISDRVDEIRRLIAERSSATFEDIIHGRTGRDQRIVSFLAVLELVKQRVINAQQERRFAPITIGRVYDEAQGHAH